MSHATKLCANPDFCQGVQLFNAGSFWHAHEAWEIVWLQRDGEQRLCLQGLIQCAAALVHWQRGNLRGLHLNWHKARQKLAGLPVDFETIELTPLIAWMDAMTQTPTLAAPQIVCCLPQKPEPYLQ